MNTCISYHVATIFFYFYFSEALFLAYGIFGIINPISMPVVNVHVPSLVSSIM